MMDIPGGDAFGITRRTAFAGMAASAAVSTVPALAWPSQLQPRFAEFQRTKFGMFVHWGPYSQASLEASWPIMNPSPKWAISEKDYVALAQSFNPAAFDPHAIIDAAKSAGQRYIVFTTKHHDGFCMFDSSYTDYKITNSPYGKDIVKLLADVCAARDMPLGFYYSPPDMHHPGFRDTSRPAASNWQGQPERPEWSSYLQYMELQLTELLTRYGPVATIWFDGLAKQEKYDGQRFVDLIRRLQPSTLVNDRIGTAGDYLTPEQFIPAGIPIRGMDFDGTDTSVQKSFKRGVPDLSDFQPWETCMTINDTWAYNARDHRFKSARDLIRGLVDVASKGGNMLLNIGPQPDGRIQPEFRARLSAIGEWMAVNGESVYDTLFGPIQDESAYRTTARGDCVYVHLLDAVGGTLKIKPLRKRVREIRLLADKRVLSFTQDASGILIDLAGVKADPNVTVIRVTTS
jgi:alpha-L-fucosidase